MSENDTAEQGRPVIEVRTLAEDEWATYREVRLRALKESPEAFAADLADALMRVLEDPARAEEMGRAGRERAIEHFSWESIADRTLEVYRSVAA